MSTNVTDKVNLKQKQGKKPNRTKPMVSAPGRRLKKSDIQPRASASYLALARVYPIHPIRSDADLDLAIATLDGLQVRPEPLDSQEQDYLESLANEIERYESEAYPMPAVSGADMLRHLLDAHDTSISAVAEATQIAVSTLSAVLKNKRKLNLNHIRALATHFGVENAVFLE
jgi:HTH-type transcriptional regulator/antitoxin HigA